jgi:uncharacterized repeat protein (TIGR01451 family)
VVWDPFTCTDDGNDGIFNGADAACANAKAIPGAVLEYCLVVKNTGSSDSTSVTLTDTVPGNVTYFASSLAQGTGEVCGTAGIALPGGSGFAAGTVTVDFGTLVKPVPAPTLPNTDKAWATFRVTVD